VHPDAERFPLMKDTDPDALCALGEDIEKNGLSSPIALWRARPDAQAQLLDGRNRLDAIEAVIGPIVSILPYIAVEGGRVAGWAKVLETEHVPDPLAFVLSANVHRRHLTAEQRQAILIELIARAPTKSDRQIAKDIGVDHKTIARARTKGEDVGRIPHVENRTDTKGRQQPATKSKSKSKRSNPGPKGCEPTPPPKAPSDHAVTAAVDREIARSEAAKAKADAIGPVITGIADMVPATEAGTDPVAISAAWTDEDWTRALTALEPERFQRIRRAVDAALRQSASTNLPMKGDQHV
jgi:hypothetical protein